MQKCNEGNGIEKSDKMPKARKVVLSLMHSQIYVKLKSEKKRVFRISNDKKIQKQKYKADKRWQRKALNFEIQVKKQLANPIYIFDSF